MQNQSYTDSIKNRHQYYKKRLLTLANVIFQDPEKASAKLQKAILSSGILKAAKFIEADVSRFGKLKGRRLFGNDNPERQSAMAMVKEFKIAMEKEHLLRLEYQQAKRLEELEAAHKQQPRTDSSERA